MPAQSVDFLLIPLDLWTSQAEDKQHFNIISNNILLEGIRFAAGVAVLIH